MSEPLEQFQAWYDDYTKKRAASSLADSEYSLARAAFYGGFAARPQEERQPSRYALDMPSTTGPRPYARPMTRFMPAPALPPGPRAAATNPQPLLTPEAERELAAAEALVARWRTAAESLASTNAAWSSHFYDCASELERALAIERKIDDSMDHIERIWEGQQYGPPGPVLTASQLQDDYDREWWDG